MREPGARFVVGSAALCLTPPAPLTPVGGRSARLALAPLPQPTVRLAAMTAEEMKATENGAQSAPLPLEGVDISPKQDEGVLKVRGGRGDPGWRLVGLKRVARTEDGGICHPSAGCGPKDGTVAAHSRRVRPPAREGAPTATPT